MKAKKIVEAKSDLSKLAELEPAIAPISVGEIMTKNVVCLSPHETFAEAIGLMANRPFRHFLVVEDDDRLVGVVSDRDLLRILARTPSWQKTRVAEVMTRTTITVHPDTPLSTAIDEMLLHRINCLPVVDDKECVLGIVTSTDLLRVLKATQTCLERVREVELA